MAACLRKSTTHKRISKDPSRVADARVHYTVLKQQTTPHTNPLTQEETRMTCPKTPHTLHKPPHPSPPQPVKTSKERNQETRAYRARLVASDPNSVSDTPHAAPPVPSNQPHTEVGVLNTAETHTNGHIVNVPPQPPRTKHMFMIVAPK